MKVNILKNLVLVLISSFVGIMVNPELLAASDTVKLNGLDTSNIVETVVLEPEVEEPVAEKTAATVATPVVTAPRAGQAAKLTQAQAAEQETKPTQVAPSNNVTFSWGTQELFVASSTAVNSGSKVARVGKLIWGHNYTAFGNITKLTIGSTFTVMENGRTTKYRVVANPINGAAGVVLDKKGESTLSYADDARYSNIDMNALVNYGMGHSLVLLTCYGSNSRYVVVADAV